MMKKKILICLLFFFFINIIMLFFQHLEKLTTLCVDNNEITDVKELEHLKQLKNLEYLNLEHNQVLKINIHQQILDNDTDTCANIDSTFCNLENSHVSVSGISCAMLIIWNNISIPCVLEV